MELFIIITTMNTLKDCVVLDGFVKKDQQRLNHQVTTKLVQFVQLVIIVQRALSSLCHVPEVNGFVIFALNIL